MTARRRGWPSSGAGWAEAVERLQASGLTVRLFDPSRPGLATGHGPGAARISAHQGLLASMTPPTLTVPARRSRQWKSLALTLVSEARGRPARPQPRRTIEQPPAAPAGRGHAQACGHGTPARLRTPGQPGLGAVLAARRPGESGDDQGRHASATNRKTPRLARSPRPSTCRTSSSVCHRTRDLPSFRPGGIGREGTRRPCVCITLSDCDRSAAGVRDPPFWAVTRPPVWLLRLRRGNVLPGGGCPVTAAGPGCWEGCGWGGRAIRTGSCCGRPGMRGWLPGSRRRRSSACRRR